MIRNKRMFQYYLAADAAANGLKTWKWWYRYKYHIVYVLRLLRHIEYLENCRPKLFGRFVHRLQSFRFYRAQRRLGFTLAPNVFGPGLQLPHYGTIVVNAGARIGRNCRIHIDVNIGAKGGQAPVIGDNVYIGPGAKIFGGIAIGDNVAIGANAVVNADVPSDVSVAGVPARIVGKGSQGLIIDGCAFATGLYGDLEGMEQARTGSATVG